MIKVISPFIELVLLSVFEAYNLTGDRILKNRFVVHYFYWRFVPSILTGFKTHGSRGVLVS